VLVAPGKKSFSQKIPEVIAGGETIRCESALTEDATHRAANPYRDMAGALDDGHDRDQGPGFESQFAGRQEANRFNNARGRNLEAAPDYFTGSSETPHLVCAGSEKQVQHGRQVTAEHPAARGQGACLLFVFSNLAGALSVRLCPDAAREPVACIVRSIYATLRARIGCRIGIGRAPLGIAARP
jgi:hypothetical protein